MDGRSSVLLAAEMLVSGVWDMLPGAESLGVDVEVAVEVPFCLEACFAAFSASLFCFDAEGGIVND
jgi:hypothetical protein